MDKKTKSLIGTFGIMAVVAILLNLALIGGVVWVIVKVLQWMGVL